MLSNNMSMTRFIVSNITRLYSPYLTPRVLSTSTRILKHQTLTASQGMRYRSFTNHVRSMQKQHHYANRRKFSVYSSIQPGGAPLPPQPPSSSLKWILGIMLTIVLPFVANAWGTLLKYKFEVDTTVETIEEVVDVVEKVAEVVDKVAEGISDELPEGGKLKKIVDFVEDVAEETFKDAHTVGDAIDKFQEVEGKVEGIIGILGAEDKEMKDGK